MNQSRGRVLILDDEPSIGRMISLMAQELQLEAMSVTNPGMFFTALTAWVPTHVILDLIMPEMDGVEVLQQLGYKGCTARIAISSGVGNRVLGAAQLSAAEHGLDVAGLLPKPIKMRELQEFLYSSPDPNPAERHKKPFNEQGEMTITRADIQGAIREKQFRLIYQPKINCASGRITGFEALVRWDHPTKGLIMPDRFIALSERLGLIGLITDQVVDQALNWYISTPEVEGQSISINISAKTLEDQDFSYWLDVMCNRAAVPKELIILEITETAALDDQLLALDMFTRLRMKGFHVSIDDFGIGTSSLRLLARLPFSEIKVDKSFAMTVVKSSESKIILQSTVDLSHHLGLSVVVEGVEDRETLDFLQEIGCDMAQGYHIARPMSGESIANWILERQPRAIFNLS